MATRLLIVDDETESLDAAAAFFESAGFSVRRAASAEEALPLSSGGVDAVLMDVEMGGLSGLLAVVAMVKKTKAPIFLMTGHSDLEIEKDALLLGARALFAKPLDLPAVLAKLEAALAG